MHGKRLVRHIYTMHQYSKRATVVGKCVILPLQLDEKGNHAKERALYSSTNTVRS